MRSLFLCLLLAACSGQAPEMGTPVALPSELVSSVELFEGRADCHWRRPGLNPFKGNVVAALAALNVPIDRRELLAARIRSGDSDGIVQAGRGGIVSSSHVLFAPGIAMTFGARTICYNTTVDYDGVQSGRLYIDHGFYIWVPDVCGNVSRLLPSWEVRTFDKSSRLDVVPGVTRKAQPYFPIPGAIETNVIPEPETIGLFLLGLIVMFLIGWIRRLKRAKPDSLEGSTIVSVVWECATKEACEAEKAALRAQIDR